MKTILFITALLFSNYFVYSQEDKTVTLTVVGQGKTKDEAKLSALRSALEQAFGAFISSKTEILNDSILKDEIVAVTNGNIQDYSILSETILPDNFYGITLKVKVSLLKLTKFCEGKGINIEYKGGLFADNITNIEMNESNEILACKNISYVLKNIISSSIDYTISADSPEQKDDMNTDIWNINFKINVIFNSNITLFKNYLINSMDGISMSYEDALNYNSLNKRVFEFIIFERQNTDSIQTHIYYLRNIKSLAYIQDLFWYCQYSERSFLINDGINKISLFENNYLDSYEFENYKIDKSHRHDNSFYRDYYKYSWDYNSRYSTEKNYYHPCNDFFVNGTSASDDITYEILLKKLKINYLSDLSENGKKDRLGIWADSTHIYCNSYDGSPGIGYISTNNRPVSQQDGMDGSFSNYTEGSWLHSDLFIRLFMQPKELIGTFNLKKEYSLEEIKKINSLIVSPQKIKIN